MKSLKNIWKSPISLPYLQPEFYIDLEFDRQKKVADTFWMLRKKQHDLLMNEPTDRWKSGLIHHFN